MTKKPSGRGLGRGLSALLGEAETAVAAAPGGQARAAIETIRPNPAQPRRRFDAKELDELAASIADRGVIQPLLVRPDPSGAGYQIVAGERRWRAAQKARLHEVPIVVRDLDDREVLELAIIENVQRTDLDPVEEAGGYAALMEQFGHTQERLAEAMGKSRSHIANVLRLLTLPESVLEHLRAGRLSAGHARALVTAADPEALAAQVIARRLSVRETEALARAGKTGAPGRRAPRARKDADTRALEADLGAGLGLGVSIEHRGDRGGEVRIRYRSLEELDGLCQLLSR